MKKWKIEHTNEIFKGRIFTLKDKSCHHPEKNIKHDFYVLETYDWINVIALTTDNKIILVKQHRLGTDEITIETPGGIIEDGESPETCAQRELLEETGFRAGNITLLKKLSANPAILNNYIYFFLATDCKYTGQQHLDDAEDIEITTYTHEQTIKLIQSGSIDHSIIVNALSLYFLSKHCKYMDISL